MVGVALEFVKNRHGQIVPSTVPLLTPHLQGRPNPPLLARVERGESSTARSASTRGGWACSRSFS